MTALTSTAASPTQKDDTKTWFTFVLVYMFIDYGRPQDLLPIGFMRPGMLIILTLTFFVFRYNGFSRAKSKQINYIWWLIAIMFLLIPFAMNNFWAYDTWMTMMKYMPFVLSIVVCVNSMERLRKFMQIYIGVMFYISGWVIVHGGTGPGAYFADENDVSLYINMVMPFCYFLFLSESRFMHKMFYLTCLVMGLAAVILSFSRGGFVGLVVMFFIIWLVSPRKMASLTAIILLAGIAYMYAGDAYKADMATITDTKEDTANERIMSWITAWDMFLDNPLGVGGTNFGALFSDYQGDRFSRDMWGRAAHSLWFTLIPELGIFGIWFYFRLMIANLKDSFAIKSKEFTDDPDMKYLNAMSIAFVASMAGFFASATFISVLYYPHYWYLSALIVATLAIAKVHKKKLEDEAVATTT